MLVLASEQNGVGAVRSKAKYGVDAWLGLFNVERAQGGGHEHRLQTGEASDELVGQLGGDLAWVTRPRNPPLSRLALRTEPKPVLRGFGRSSSGSADEVDVILASRQQDIDYQTKAKAPGTEVDDRDAVHRVDLARIHRSGGWAC